MKPIKFIIAALTILIISVITMGCMSPQSFNDMAEEEEKNSTNVIPYLNLKMGAVVADIGAGGGYFSYKLSKAVGENGKVFSVDVNKESVEFIQRKTEEKGLTNIEVILAAFDDSKLKAGTIDLVFIRNAYHDIQNRVIYFSKLKAVLKRNGRVAIIDYDPDKLGFFRNLYGHALEEKTIKAEMEQAGYVLKKSYPILNQQSFNIFVPGTKK